MGCRSHAPGGAQSARPSQEPAVSNLDESVRATKILLDVVDLLDEVERVAKGPAPKTAAMDFVSERLKSLIETYGGTLIRLPEWDPQLQRAVAVENPSNAKGTNRILRCGASGLRMGDRIIRKQEVVLTDSTTRRS